MAKEHFNRPQDQTDQQSADYFQSERFKKVFEEKRLIASMGNETSFFLPIEVEPVGTAFQAFRQTLLAQGFHDVVSRDHYRGGEYPSRVPGLEVFLHKPDMGYKVKQILYRYFTV